MVVHVSSCPGGLVGNQVVKDFLHVFGERIPFIHIHDHGKGVNRNLRHGHILAEFCEFEILHD